MELDLKGVAFYLKDIMNQSIMSSVALSIAFSCKNIYACMLLMHLCNTLSQYIHKGYFYKDFFVRNQAEILQIYYRVTSLLLLKELRLAENPIPYKKNSSVYN